MSAFPIVYKITREEMKNSCFAGEINHAGYDINNFPEKMEIHVNMKNCEDAPFIKKVSVLNGDTCKVYRTYDGRNAFMIALICEEIISKRLSATVKKLEDENRLNNEMGLVPGEMDQFRKRWDEIREEMKESC